MKKQFILLASLILAICFAAHSQTQKVRLSETPLDRLAMGNFHPSIMANFISQYPQAGDATWRTTKTGYFVHFTSGDVIYYVFLNQNGVMNSQMRYFSEKDMPAALRKQIERAYTCYAIGLTKEITVEKSKIYLVTISNATTWKVIRVDGDEMNVFEEHDKG